MRVDPAAATDHLTAAASARRSAPDASRTTFATALRAVTDTTATPAVPDSAETAATTTGTRSAGTAATGGAASPERTEPVEGKPYERILSGPRKGMYINRSGNARDGEAFVLVEKPGRDIHVYGTGKDRETVVMWHAGAAKPPAGEVAVKVAGEDYEKIIAGPRKGLYVNRSGNARDGVAFRLVKHAHGEEHVYGTGEYRQAIGVRDTGRHGANAAASGDGATTPAGTTASSSATGGVTAPPAA